MNRALYNKNKRILYWIYQVREYIHRQDSVNTISVVSLIAQEITPILTEVIEKKDFFAEFGLAIDEEYLLCVLRQMLAAQTQEDYILYGDLLQLQILPILIDVQNAIRNSGEDLVELYWNQNMEALKDKDPQLYRQMLSCEELHRDTPYCEDVYSVEDTTVGDLTVAVTAERQSLYLYSNENPKGYVRPWIDSCYNPYIDDYVVYGLGLGYHCEYLASKDYDLHLTILENDIGMIQLAMTYTDMSWYFNHPGVRICYDGDWMQLRESLRDADKKIVLFHEPSVRRIKDKEIANLIQRYMVYEGSSRARNDRMIQNFRYNTNHCDCDLSEVEQRFHGKTVIIVGAGPSLDKNVHILKERHEDVIILAMGAVCRKLHQMGVPMDYIIITDPKVISNAQIQGVEDCGVPMLVLSTATKGIARNYHGHLYMLCQKGFEDAEQFAVEHHLPIFETGGSVATTAVDLCIRFKANQIVFVGLDMAYTGNRNHASGARDEGITDYQDMIMVDGVYGDKVPTTQPFQMYREWIERRMARADVNMPVVDATEGGAKIKGTEVKMLRDVISAI